MLLERSLRGSLSLITVIALLLITTVVRAQSSAPVQVDASRDGLAYSQTDTRRSPQPAIVGYWGFGPRFDTALVGGLWWGVTGSVGVRWLDRLDFRLDSVGSLLVPSSKKRECGEPPCAAGIRGLLSPSIGHRIPIGTIGVHERSRVALTPSIGLAFGVQRVAESGAAAFDAKTPSSWILLEPGLALSIGGAEFRSHVRIPRGAIQDPMFDIAFGAALPF